MLVHTLAIAGAVENIKRKFQVSESPTQSTLTLFYTNNNLFEIKRLVVSLLPLYSVPTKSKPLHKESTVIVFTSHLPFSLEPGSQAFVSNFSFLQSLGILSTATVLTLLNPMVNFQSPHSDFQLHSVKLTTSFFLKHFFHLASKLNFLLFFL